MSFGVPKFLYPYSFGRYAVGGRETSLQQYNIQSTALGIYRYMMYKELVCYYILYCIIIIISIIVIEPRLA